MADKAGRVIFIGNIPYGLSEEQIVHIFNTAGLVLNFRLVHDTETGRPKGFGFAEFADKDSAESAVRNLNNHKIMGRELRVDFSHVGGKDQDGASVNNTNIEPQHLNQSHPPNGYQPPPTGLPPLPPGVDLPPGLTCPDAISRTLSTLQPSQLLDILSQMKGLVMGDPSKANELLKQAPQLSYAIFQALLLMGLVDTSVLASVVEAGAQQQQQQPQPQPPPQQVPPRPNIGYQPPPPQPYPQFSQVQNQIHVPTPPIHNQPYQPPPVQHPPPQQQAPGQEELLKQVMAMTQQQIDQLPLGDRAQIMTLRQTLMGQRF